MLVALAWSGLAFCGEIHDAARDGDLAKVKALLKVNPDLVFSTDTRLGATPLHFAASMGSKNIAELLLANKADVNAKAKDGRTPLHLAAQLGHKDVVELLLANNASVDAKADGSTPLHLAALEGHEDVVELL
jgi:ankyrin repeat protein